MRNTVVILLAVQMVIGKAQTPASSLSDTAAVAKTIGLHLHHGFVLIHSRNLVPVRHSNPTGLELNFAWHQTSDKAWVSCHCYPKIGFAATYWHFDQPEILGHSLTGLFYIEPVFGAWRKLHFSVRAGFGLSYQNKPYDEVTNPLNLSYSTKLAFPLQLGSAVYFRLKPRWLLDATLVYNHISNGGIRTPNAGINWPTAAVGLHHYWHTPALYNRAKKDWRTEHPPKTRLDATLFLAFKEPSSKLYLFSPGIEWKASRQVTRMSALTLGGEWLYNNGARVEIAQAGRTENPHQIGVAIGHEFLLGKFLFGQQFGAYVYKPYRVRDDVYQRYSLLYRISNNVSAGISLRAHKHVAEFVDVRLGYSF
jgi:hypothetical protein